MLSSTANFAFDHEPVTGCLKTARSPWKISGKQAELPDIIDNEIQDSFVN